MSEPDNQINPDPEVAAKADSKTEPKAVIVERMFSRIVRRYDLMNGLMTFGLDRRWRRLAVQVAQVERYDVALDLATGTGELAFELARAGASRVVGLDLTEGMLEVARKKAISSPHRDKIEFVRGDALSLPFDDNSFNVVTVGWGLRNVEDLSLALREAHRVLKPGGRLACVEMSHSPVLPVRIIFKPYFEIILPIIGGLVSGDYAAYRYLPESVRGFPDAPKLSRLFFEVGFRQVRHRYLGLGAVALHVGTKTGSA